MDGTGKPFLSPQFLSKAVAGLRTIFRLLPGEQPLPALLSERPDGIANERNQEQNNRLIHIV